MFPILKKKPRNRAGETFFKSVRRAFSTENVLPLTVSGTSFVFYLKKIVFKKVGRALCLYLYTCHLLFTVRVDSGEKNQLIMTCK